MTRTRTPLTRARHPAAYRQYSRNKTMEYESMNARDIECMIIQYKRENDIEEAAFIIQNAWKRYKSK